MINITFRHLRIVLPVLLTLAAVLACAPSPSAPTPAPTPTPTSAPTSTPPAVVTEVAVTARYATFLPTTITVVKEQTVKLVITSQDIAHTFTIDELGINIAIGAGQTVTKEFMAEKVGFFTFYCAKPGHRSAGMVGTLTVTGQTGQPAPPPAPAPTKPPAPTDNASGGGVDDY